MMQALAPEITLPSKVTTSADETSVQPTSAAAARPPIAFRGVRTPFKDIETLPHAGKYSAELAYVMAVVSAWAYADENVLRAKLAYYGLKDAHIRRITVQNNAMLVVTTAYLIQSKTGKVAVLAFRGTDPGNLITVLTDVQVMQRAFHGGLVHAGFSDSVEVVWDDLYTLLGNARDGVHIGAGDAPVALTSKLEALYITGHSLGGAMALLTAARLFEDDVFAQDQAPWVARDAVKGIYTYGQPMVGDRAFSLRCADEFGKRLHRHVFDDDVVPCLPPISGLDYVHTGEERRAGALDQSWGGLEPASKRKRMLRSALEVIGNFLEARLGARDLFSGVTIDDHLPANYVEVSRVSLRGPTARKTPSFVAAAVSRAVDRMLDTVEKVTG